MVTSIPLDATNYNIATIGNAAITSRSASALGFTLLNDGYDGTDGYVTLQGTTAYTYTASPKLYGGANDWDGEIWVSLQPTSNAYFRIWVEQNVWNSRLYSSVVLEPGGFSIMNSNGATLDGIELTAVSYRWYKIVWSVTSAHLISATLYYASAFDGASPPNPTWTALGTISGTISVPAGTAWALEAYCISSTGYIALDALTYTSTAWLPVS